MNKKILTILYFSIFMLYSSSSYTRMFALEQQARKTVNFRASIQQDISSSLEKAIIEALSSNGDFVPNTTIYEVTSLRNESDWVILSVQSTDGDGCKFNVDFFHVVPISCSEVAIGQQGRPNNWAFGIRGTKEFNTLLKNAPEHVISSEAKIYLDPNTSNLHSTTMLTYKFPWVGTWQYWNGWHGPDTGGNGLDIGTSGSDKRVLAAASGTILDICPGSSGSANVKIQHNDGTILNYAHLEYSTLESGIEELQPVVQGQVLGSLKSGSFPSDGCGYANQNATSAHLHWDFETQLTSYTIDGWAIDFNFNAQCGTGSNWTNGSSTIRPCQAPYDTLISTNSPVTSGCCGCTAVLFNSQRNLSQPNFMDQFAVEGPTYTAVPDPQNNTTGPEPWPTLSLPTQAPAFVQNGWDAAWANKSTLTVNWSLANTDTLTGYQLFWDQSATTSGSEKPLMLSAKATGAEIPVAASGVWYVHLRAMSKDGGVSETVHAGPFNIDLTPPQMVSASLPETSWVSNPQPPTFHWPAASDEASGLGGYRVYWGDDANGQSDALVTETSYTPSETMASSSSAVRYLRVAAEDAVGNVGEWQTVAVWRYDNLPPIGTLAVGSGGEEVRSLNVTLNISGSDQQGAITDMRFSSNGTLWSAWQPYQTTQFWQLANTPEKQAVYMQLRDEAGNVSKPITAEVVAVLNADNPTSSSYELASSTFGMGGGTKSSASYTVNGTSGQTHETGSASSPSYQVNSGYWVDPDTGCTAVSAAAPLIETTVSNQVKLSWASVPNATSYNIYRSTNAPYFTPSTLYDTANTSPWYDDGAIGTPSSNYFYIIRAVGSCGESVNSQRLGKFDFAIQPGSP